MPTEMPPEVDVDEEGSPMQPEEGVLRSPVAKKAEQAAQCEDVFCETKTVEESPLMKLSEQEREAQLKKTRGPASGR